MTEIRLGLNQSETPFSLSHANLRDGLFNSNRGEFVVLDQNGLGIYYGDGKSKRFFEETAPVSHRLAALDTTRRYSIVCMCFDVKHRGYWVCGSDMSLKFFDEDFHEICRLPDSPRVFLKVFFDPRTDYLIVADVSCVRFWNISAHLSSQTVVPQRPAFIVDTDPYGWVSAISVGAVHPPSMFFACGPNVLEVAYETSGIRKVFGDLHGAEIRHVCYLNGLDMFVTAGRDCMIKAWYRRTGQLYSVLRGHHGCITGLHGAGDDTIVTCSRDGSVRLWNVQTIRCFSKVVVPFECLGLVCMQMETMPYLEKEERDEGNIGFDAMLKEAQQRESQQRVADFVITDEASGVSRRATAIRSDKAKAWGGETSYTDELMHSNRRARAVQQAAADRRRIAGRARRFRESRASVRSRSICVLGNGTAKFLYIEADIELVARLNTSVVSLSRHDTPVLRGLPALVAVSDDQMVRVFGAGGKACLALVSRTPLCSINAVALCRHRPQILTVSEDSSVGVHPVSRTFQVGLAGDPDNIPEEIAEDRPNVVIEVQLPAKLEEEDVFESLVAPPSREGFHEVNKTVVREVAVKIGSPRARRREFRRGAESSKLKPPPLQPAKVSRLDSAAPHMLLSKPSGEVQELATASTPSVGRHGGKKGRRWSVLAKLFGPGQGARVESKKHLHEKRNTEEATLTPALIFGTKDGHLLVMVPDKDRLPHTSSDTGLKQGAFAFPCAKVLARFKAHRTPITHLLYVPAHRVLITVGHASRVKVWKFPGGRMIRTLRTVKDITCITADRESVYVGTRSGKIWRAKFFEDDFLHMHDLSHYGAVTSLDYHMPRDCVLSSGADGGIKVVKAETGLFERRPLLEFSCGSEILAACFESVDGSIAFSWMGDIFRIPASSYISPDVLAQEVAGFPEHYDKSFFAVVLSDASDSLKPAQVALLKIASYMSIRGSQGRLARLTAEQAESIREKVEKERQEAQRKKDLEEAEHLERIRSHRTPTPVIVIRRDIAPDLTAPAMRKRTAEDDAAEAEAAAYANRTALLLAEMKAADLAEKREREELARERERWERAQREAEEDWQAEEQVAAPASRQQSPEAHGEGASVVVESIAEQPTAASPQIKSSSGLVPKPSVSPRDEAEIAAERKRRATAKKIRRWKRQQKQKEKIRISGMRLEARERRLMAAEDRRSHKVEAATNMLVQRYGKRWEVVLHERRERQKEEAGRRLRLGRSKSLGDPQTGRLLSSPEVAHMELNRRQSFNGFSGKAWHRRKAAAAQRAARGTLPKEDKEDYKPPGDQASSGEVGAASGTTMHGSRRFSMVDGMRGAALRFSVKDPYTVVKEDEALKKFQAGRETGAEPAAKRDARPEPLDVQRGAGGLGGPASRGLLRHDLQGASTPHFLGRGSAAALGSSASLSALRTPQSPRDAPLPSPLASSPRDTESGVVQKKMLVDFTESDNVDIKVMDMYTPAVDFKTNAPLRAVVDAVQAAARAARFMRQTMQNSKLSHETKAVFVSNRDAITEIVEQRKRQMVKGKAAQVLGSTGGRVVDADESISAIVKAGMASVRTATFRKGSSGDATSSSSWDGARGIISDEESLRDVMDINFSDDSAAEEDGSSPGLRSEKSVSESDEYLYGEEGRRHSMAEGFSYARKSMKALRSDLEAVAESPHSLSDVSATSDLGLRASRLMESLDVGTGTTEEFATETEHAFDTDDNDRAGADEASAATQASSSAPSTGAGSKDDQVLSIIASADAESATGTGDVAKSSETVTLSDFSDADPSLLRLSATPAAAASPKALDEEEEDRADAEAREVLELPSDAGEEVLGAVELAGAPLARRDDMSSSSDGTETSAIVSPLSSDDESHVRAASAAPAADDGPQPEPDDPGLSSASCTPFEVGHAEEEPFARDAFHALVFDGGVPKPAAARARAPSMKASRASTRLIAKRPALPRPVNNTPVGAFSAPVKRYDVMKDFSERSYSRPPRDFAPRKAPNRLPRATVHKKAAAPSVSMVDEEGLSALRLSTVTSAAVGSMHTHREHRMPMATRRQDGEGAAGEAAAALGGGGASGGSLRIRMPTGQEEKESDTPLNTAAGDSESFGVLAAMPVDLHEKASDKDFFKPVVPRLKIPVAQSFSRYAELYRSPAVPLSGRGEGDVGSAFDLDTRTATDEASAETGLGSARDSTTWYALSRRIVPKPPHTSPAPDGARAAETARPPRRAVRLAGANALVPRGASTQRPAMSFSGSASTGGWLAAQSAFVQQKSLMMLSARSGSAGSQSSGHESSGRRLPRATKKRPSGLDFGVGGNPIPLDPTAKWGRGGL